MGINRHMKPQGSRYMQTYVDQYVPLPFKEMEAAMQKSEQDVIDLGDEITDTRALLEVKAMSEDRAKRDAMLEAYEAQISDMVTTSGGNYNDLRKGIHDLSGVIHKDLTRGNLSRVSRNYANRQAELKAQAEGVKAGYGNDGYTRDWGDKRLGANSMYYKDHDDYDATGTVVDYNPQGFVNQTDWDATLDKAVTGFKADVDAWASAGIDLKTDPDGNTIMKYKGSNERVKEEDILLFVDNYLDGNPAFKQEVQEMKALGATDAEVTEWENGLRSNMMNKFGYLSEKRDANRSYIPEWLANGRDADVQALLTLDSPVQQEFLGGVYDTPGKLNDAIANNGNAITTEFAKLTESYTGIEIPNVPEGSVPTPDMMMDALTKAQQNGAIDAKDYTKIVMLYQDQNRLKKVRALATRKAEETDPGLKKASGYFKRTGIDPTTLLYADSDYDDDAALTVSGQAKVTAGYKIQTEIASRYGWDISDGPGGQRPAIVAALTAVKSRGEDTSELEESLAAFDIINDYSKKDNKKVTEYNNYLKEVSINRPMAATSDNLFRQYRTVNGKQVLDKEATKAMTKLVNEELGDPLKLIGYNASYKSSSGDWAEGNILGAIKEVYGDSNDVMKGIKISKAAHGNNVDRNGEEFALVTVSKENMKPIEFHIPMTNQLVNAQSLMNDQVDVDIPDGKGGSRRVPVPVALIDKYIIDNYKIGLSSDEIRDSNGNLIGTLDISQVQSSDKQQGAYTFANDENLQFIPANDPSHPLVGQKALDKLAILHAKNLLH